MITALLRPATLATFVAVASTVGAAAQTTAVDPHHPNPTLAWATPPSGIQGMSWQGGQRKAQKHRSDGAGPQTLILIKELCHCSPRIQSFWISAVAGCHKSAWLVQVRRGSRRERLLTCPSDFSPRFSNPPAKTAS